MIRDALGLGLDLPQEGSSTLPRVGDVWVVSSNGVDEGVVLISAVRDGYVLAWPVTSCAENASFPSFELSLANVAPLVAWPEAEFGLANAGLNRGLGNAISPELASKVMRSLRTGAHIEGIKHRPVRVDPAADDALDAVCAEAWRLGELAERQGDERIVFDPAVLTAADITPETLEQSLSLAPARASRLHQGQAVPSEADVEGVLALLPQGTAVEDVMRPISGPEAKVVSLPAYKRHIQELARQRGMAESQARALVWETATSIAARDPRSKTDESARRRVEIAINSLLG